MREIESIHKLHDIFYLFSPQLIKNGDFFFIRSCVYLTLKPNKDRTMILTYYIIKHLVNICLKTY